jgi:hypothetical protein
MGREIVMQQVTVYFDTLDYPDLYVARLWNIVRDEERVKPEPGPVIGFSRVLDGVRVLIPQGMVRMAPAPEDVADRIVEVWI